MASTLSLRLKQNTEFFRQVVLHIRKIPKGKVATYGQIAHLAGKEQGSRGVGWILHACAKYHKLSWHRVINSQGRISFPKGSKNFFLQKKLLAQEGVQMNSSQKIDLDEFQWKKTARVRRKVLGF